MTGCVKSSSGGVTDSKSPKVPAHLYSLLQGVPACTVRESQCCNFYFCQDTPRDRDTTM